MTKTIQGFAIKIFINGKVFGEVQEASWTLDYAEQEIYGIDSVFPQEISTAKIATYGNIKGLRLRQTNGLQSINARPLLEKALANPYISIRIQDRLSGEDLLFCPNAKISSEAWNVAAKGILSLSFSFRAMSGLQPLDRK